MKKNLKQIIENCSKNIVGNEHNIKISLAAILSEGSILIEDYPGTGKTTFAKTITYNLGLDFKRIQFTSDLLPSDILGYSYFKGEELIFKKGPIFTNIVLADELNRGSAKTQSAFLEAMEEKNVTIEGNTEKLPSPFFVIATQNPMDSSGTSLLPDSQLDRFMISFSLSSLNNNQKKNILKNNYNFTDIEELGINFTEIKNFKNSIKVSENIYDYILDLEKTISSLDKDFYVSPRCLKQLIELSKSWAFINDNDFVSHQDVKNVFPNVIRHRIRFLDNGQSRDSFIKKEILEKVSINK